ncbi:TRAP transporter small permease [Vreelandella titanicae]|nr:TRAP transporter small permease [Halomonas titanicae]
MFMKVYEFISYALAAVLLLILTFLTLIDVVGRNIFNSPLAGATELTEYGLVGLTFLIYPVIALRQQHIVIDIFDSFVGRVGRIMQQLLAGIVGAVVFSLLSSRLWSQGDRLVEYGDVTPYLRLPVAPAYYFMAILAGFTAIAFIFAAFGIGKKMQDKSHPQEIVKSNKEGFRGRTMTKPASSSLNPSERPISEAQTGDDKTKT